MSLYPREELLLNFCPLSFLDDVEQIIDDYLADGVDVLEDNIIKILGLEVLDDNIPATEKEKQLLCLRQCGDKFLKILRENFDKNLDKFDIYCLRNIFTLSDDIKLEHVQEFLKRNSPSIEETLNDDDESHCRGPKTDKIAMDTDLPKTTDNNSIERNEVSNNSNLTNINQSKEAIPDIKEVDENHLVSYLDNKYNRPISSKDEDMIDHELDEIRNKLRKVRRRKERVNVYLERSQEYVKTMEEGASSIALSKKELNEYSIDSLHDSMNLLVRQQREFFQLSNLSQNLQDSLIAGPGGELNIDNIQSQKRKRQQNNHPYHYKDGNKENSGPHTNSMKQNDGNDSIRKKNNVGFDTSLFFSSSGRRSSLSQSKNRRSTSLDFRGASQANDGVSDIHIRNKSDVHLLIAALTGK